MDLSEQKSMKQDLRLPIWLKKTLGPLGSLHPMKRTLRQSGLHTVCESASCPNLGECWSKGTATFMILGDVCTRHCGFCDVTTGKPREVDQGEPRAIAAMVKQLGLKHVVITCVARDDLPDRGTNQFLKCIREIRLQHVDITIDILTTDFSLIFKEIDKVLDAKPDIFNHNVETVRRLTPVVRHKATYENSLRFMSYLKEKQPYQVTKSGFMLGLGETKDEAIETLVDLRNVGCEMVTIGQYLRPSRENLPVEAYIEPKEFEEYEKIAYEIGFQSVASGPFVRSSYYAEKMIKNTSRVAGQKNRSF